jgi:hypothetical protein
MKTTIAQVATFFTFMISSQGARAPVSYLSLAQSNRYTNAPDPPRAKRTCFDATRVASPSISRQKKVPRVRTWRFAPFSHDKCRTHHCRLSGRFLAVKRAEAAEYRAGKAPI